MEAPPGPPWPDTELRRQLNAWCEGLFLQAEQADGCPSMNVTEFAILRTLGSGFFGVVYLGAHRDDIFAIKVQRKIQFRIRNTVEDVCREKRFMFAMKSQFVVRLFGKWKSKDNLFLVMEFAALGDLEYLLKGCPERRLPETRARQVLGQVVLGLGYIHACNIVHRDLKPDAILIFKGGRVKLGDFGRAVRARCNMHAFIGRRDCPPTQNFEGNSYSDVVDWYAFGIMLYEALFGTVPFSRNLVRFHGVQGDKIDERINDENMSGEVKELIRGLLAEDLTRRLGVMVNGVDDIKNHAWFTAAKFDWTALVLSEKPIDFLDSEVRVVTGTPVTEALFRDGPDSDDPRRSDFEKF